MKPFRWDALSMSATSTRVIQALNQHLGELVRVFEAQQASGTVLLVPTASATTLFTLVLSRRGLYTVFATVQGGGATQMATAAFGSDGVTLARLSGVNGATMALTNVLGAVKATQSAGSPKDVQWTYLFSPC